MRGRKSKSPKFKLLEGSRGEIPRYPKLRPVLAKRRAPGWLPKFAKQFWKAQFPELIHYGILKEIDLPAFASLCISYDTMRQAQKILEEEGLVVEGHRAVRSKHPACAVLKAATDAFHRGCLEFGLTPASRQRLDIDFEKDDENDGSEVLT